MFSFFINLFKKNDIISNDDLQAKKDTVISIKVEIETNEIPETISSIDEIMKNYDISEIKKQSTQIKDKEGILASINFIKDFVESNSIEFHELVSLLKKVIPYMKKEKTISEEEIITYITLQLDKIVDKDKVENLTVIADILSQVSNQHGLEYLKLKLGEGETDNEKTLLFFEPLILLSDFYLADRQGDMAFITIRRASMLVTYFAEKFDYLLKRKIEAAKFANVCLNEYKKANYAGYIHYEIIVFILEIACDAIAFPHLSSFYYRKSICFKEGWYFESNKDMDNALEYLNILKYKKELLNEIYNFAFNEVPLMMGIPEECIHENVYDSSTSLSNYFKNKRLNLKDITESFEILNKRPLDLVDNIHEFSAKVVKKYYDLENAGRLQ